MIRLNPKDLVDPKFLGLKYLTEENGLPLIRFWFNEHEVPFNPPNNFAKFFKKIITYGNVVPLVLLGKHDLMFYTLSRKLDVPTHIAVMINSGWFLRIDNNGMSEVTQMNKFWLGNITALIRLHVR